MADILSVVSLLLQVWSFWRPGRARASRVRRLRIRETRWSLGVFTRTTIEVERRDDRI